MTPIHHALINNHEQVIYNSYKESLKGENTIELDSQFQYKEN